jgi:hypothetical protein
VEPDKGRKLQALLQDRYLAYYSFRNWLQFRTCPTSCKNHLCSCSEDDCIKMVSCSNVLFTWGFVLSAHLPRYPCSFSSTRVSSDYTRDFDWYVWTSWRTLDILTRAYSRNVPTSRSSSLSASCSTDPRKFSSRIHTTDSWVWPLPYYQSKSVHMALSCGNMAAHADTLYRLKCSWLHFIDEPSNHRWAFEFGVRDNENFWGTSPTWYGI